MLNLMSPITEDEEPLISIPLVLPIGWKNSPPIFSTATDTTADLAKQQVLNNLDPLKHEFDDLAEFIPAPSPRSTLLPPSKSVPALNVRVPAPYCWLPPVYRPLPATHHITSFLSLCLMSMSLMMLLLGLLNSIPSSHHIC